MKTKKHKTAIDILHEAVDDGLKQYQIASILGCPAGTVSRWLTGRNRPTVVWDRLIKERGKITQSQLQK